jgi:hypothetical protein
MQYSSLIYLKFKEHDAWERILGTIKVNAGNGKPASLLSFAGMGFLPSLSVFENGALVTERNLDCLINCGFPPDSTEKFVRSLAEYGGQDILILADSYNLSTDPCTYEIYYLGGDIHTEYRTSGVDKHRKIHISDMSKWLGTTRINALSAEEKAYLKAFAADR